MKEGFIRYSKSELARRCYLGRGPFGFSAGENGVLFRVKRGTYECEECGTQFRTKELVNGEFPAEKASCLDNCFRKNEEYLTKIRLLREKNQLEEERDAAADEILKRKEDLGYVWEPCPRNCGAEIEITPCGDRRKEFARHKKSCAAAF